jgi:DNA repair ATPase RecN
MRTNLQFELAQIAAKVAHATQLSTRAEHAVSAFARQCESCVAELRAAMDRSQLDPALLGALRRLHRLQRAALRESQTKLAAAQLYEESARQEWAEARNRELSLERALRSEQRKQRQMQQTLEFAVVDDLWLQRRRRSA